MQWGTRMTVTKIPRIMPATMTMRTLGATKTTGHLSLWATARRVLVVGGTAWVVIENRLMMTG